MVVIVPFTDDGCVLLVEQFRVPLNARGIELPAGLAGGHDDANEELETAARRELIEEKPRQNISGACYDAAVRQSTLSRQAARHRARQRCAR